MKPRETCPTCGTTLGPLHDPENLRHCDACQRPNPRGFRYCGFCAAPMETAAEQVERAEMAAPAGGWPNLSRELVEMRFFLDRGALDEAFELLAILRERHPGHPELAEYSRGATGGNLRADTQVHRVVDEVLAGSPSLSSSSLPRRSVPQWNARAGDEVDEVKTQAHAAVPLGTADEEEDRTTNLDMRAPPRRAPTRAKTDKHLGAVPVPVAKAEPPRPRASEPKPRPAMTVAVPTLQAPAPFEGTDPSSTQSKAHKSLVRKRAFKSQKRSGQQMVVVEPVAVETATREPRRRRGGTRFGQHVLGRLSGKDKG